LSEKSSTPAPLPVSDSPVRGMQALVNRWRERKHEGLMLADAELELTRCADELDALRALHASTEPCPWPDLPAQLKVAQADYWRVFKQLEATEGALRQAVEQKIGELRARANVVDDGEAASDAGFQAAVVRDIADEFEALLAFPLGGERKA
jgi:hypothetical protein